MNLVDIIILLVVGVAFVAVCIRAKRKGACADCAQGGGCSGSCSSSKGGKCAAVEGVDSIAKRLSRGVK